MCCLSRIVREWKRGTTTYSGIECRIMCPVGLTWLSVDSASACQQYTNATERVCLLQSYTHSLTHSLTRFPLCACLLYNDFISFLSFLLILI